LLTTDGASALEPEALCLLLEEGLRHLKGQPGAVARLAADAAPVLDMIKGEQSFANDLVRRSPLTSGHSADPAGIATHFILIKEIP